MFGSEQSSLLLEVNRCKARALFVCQRFIFFADFFADQRCVKFSLEEEE
jgi:hypothetical protein